MHRSRVFGILFLLLSCLKASAGVLTGRIFDSHAEVLPFATVFVAGTTLGTAANASGVYRLELPKGRYEVTCQYIGYQQVRFQLTIKDQETIQHDFKLANQHLDLGEVVVHANDEDPAYRIIRKAIAKREAHLKQVKEFQTSIYLKGVLRTSKVPENVFGQKVEKGELGVDTSGRGIVYLCEEVADYYSRLPNKERTIIHSVKESGNPSGMGFSQLPSVITFYENNVQILSNINPRGHISPIADRALSYYKYKLEGSFQEDRRMIYKIKVIPKHPYEPVFFGTIYIVDDDWAIQALSLATSTRYGLEKLDTVRIDQVFLPLKRGVWVVKNQVFYPVVNILGFGLTGNFVTVYDNQKVNEPIPDTVFQPKLISSYEPSANKRDSNYWEETRPLALEQDEIRDYRYKDSLRLVEENPQRKDSLRKQANKFKPIGLLWNGYTYNDSGYKSSIRIQPLLFRVNFNSVEGLNFSPVISLNRKLNPSNTLNLRTVARYGFSNEHFNAEAAVKWQYQDKAWRGRGWSLVADGGRYVYQYNRENPVIPLVNTFSTLIFGYNELKLYERWTGALNFQNTLGNGFAYGARLAYEQRIPLQNTDNYTWARISNGYYTPNLPDALNQYHYEQHDAMVLMLNLQWQPGYKYIYYPDYKSAVASNWPVFRLEYQKGIPELLGSNVDWDKWRVQAQGRLSLSQFGKLNYQLAFGGFLNDRFVGLPDLNHLFANDDMPIKMAGPYGTSFQLAPYYMFSNTEPFALELHLDYNLLGFISNKVPGLRQAKAFFAMGTNAYYANKDFYFIEAFASLDNLGFKLYRFFRLDFLKAWDAAQRQYYGLRLGLNLQAFHGLRGGDELLEW
ncbi:MAG: carboxypeptidase-like regulatory domain-containing protein [Bacteroidetes bacterium]|nr:carboxypeptidase-like regulatory domain-containing protein [Bacteroidota bacterium]